MLRLPLYLMINAFNSVATANVNHDIFHYPLYEIFNVRLRDLNSGLFLENYVSEDLTNVTLTVLEGEVFYEVEDEYAGQSFGIRLQKGASFPIEVGVFHKVHTISDTPSCYMYTFNNNTREYIQELRQTNPNAKSGMYSPFPLIEDIPERIENFSNMMRHIGRSVSHLVTIWV